LADGFSRLGNAYKALDIDDALTQVTKILNRPSESLDVVLCVDTTQSMGKNIQAFKEKLTQAVRSGLTQARSYRVGLVFYRDYMEEYLTKVIPFTSDLDQVQRDLDHVEAEGGGDIPEAVVEGMQAGLTSFNWLGKDRILIVMGDAPQHPTPRGNITEEGMKQLADEKHVERQLIMLPQTEF
jgi:Mg-chelatase subunit ChlD